MDYNYVNIATKQVGYSERLRQLIRFEKNKILSLYYACSVLKTVSPSPAVLTILLNNYTTTQSAYIQ